MRLSKSQQSLLGGTAAGVYPAIMKTHFCNFTGVQKYTDTSATQGYFLPQNFLAASQTLIDATTTTFTSLGYTIGASLLNSGENAQYRLGEGWGNYLKAVSLRIAPVGKVKKTLTNSPTGAGSGSIKMVVLSTTKLVFVWPVLGAGGGTNAYFYAIACTFGAGGVTWGAEAAIGTLILTNANAQNQSKWTVCKQATDKVMIYYPNQAATSNLHAAAFSLTGTAIGAPGTAVQVAASASPSVWSACQMATDKSLVLTNVTTDLAYCCTTATLVVTAGSGVRWTTTPSGLRGAVCQATTDSAIAICGNNSAAGAVYCYNLTTSGTVITKNAEASTSSGSGLSYSAQNVQMISATKFIAQATGPFYMGITLSGTTCTAGYLNGLALWDAQVVFAGDSANGEFWACGNTSSLKFHKCTLASATSAANKDGSPYTSNSTYAAFDSDAANVSDFCRFAFDLGTGQAVYTVCVDTAATIELELVSLTKVNVAINGVSVATPSSSSLGQASQIYADISAGYAEITLTNNLGSFAGFVPDDLLVNCT